jgi:CubicO group peptidase (beta-lactamase class C family)
MRNAIFVVALAAAAGAGWFVTQGSRDTAAPSQNTLRQDVAPTEAESAAAYFISTSIPPVLQIAGEPLALSTLEERMAFHGVPGVSIAFLRDHEVDWTLTAGVRDVSTGEPVDADTVFQAASISKPTFATTLMMYRQLHGLDLDADINTLLTRWQLPDHDWQDSQPVT